MLGFGDLNKYILYGGLIFRIFAFDNIIFLIDMDNVNLLIDDPIVRINQFIELKYLVNVTTLFDLH